MVSKLLETKVVETGCERLASMNIFVVMNLLLLLLVVSSSCLKVWRIRKQDRIQGLALGSSFLGVLFFISQFCITSLGCLLHFPGIGCLSKADSVRFGAFTPLLLLIASLVPAIGSLMLFVFLLKHDLKEHRRRHDIAVQEDPLVKRWQPKPLWTFTQIVYCQVITLYIVLAFLPTILFVIVILLADRMTGPSVFLIGFGLIMLYYLPVLPFVTVIQSIPQLRSIWKSRLNLDKLPLDIPAFTLDTIIYVLLGVSLRQYMAATFSHFDDHWNFNVGDWSPEALWIPCTWLDYVLYGGGQAIVVVLYISLRRWYSRPSKPIVKTEDVEEDMSEHACETTPLL